MVHMSTFIFHFSVLRISCSLSDGDRTGNDFVLQHDTDDEEHEVEQEHEKAQKLAHPPLASGNGHDDEEEHEEEEDDRAEQAVAAHLYWLEVVDDVVDEPGERQTGGRMKHKWRRVIIYEWMLNCP